MLKQLKNTWPYSQSGRCLHREIGNKQQRSHKMSPSSNAPGCSIWNFAMCILISPRMLLSCIILAVLGVLMVSKSEALKDFEKDEAVMLSLAWTYLWRYLIPKSASHGRVHYELCSWDSPALIIVLENCDAKLKRVCKTRRWWDFHSRNYISCILQSNLW